MQLREAGTPIPAGLPVSLAPSNDAPILCAQWPKDEDAGGPVVCSGPCCQPQKYAMADGGEWRGAQIYLVGEGRPELYCFEG